MLNLQWFSLHFWAFNYGNVEISVVFIHFLSINSWNVEISCVFIACFSINYGDVEISVVFIAFLEVPNEVQEWGIKYGVQKWGTRMRCENEVKNDVQKFEHSRIFGGQNPSVSCPHLAGPMLSCPKILIFGKKAKMLKFRWFS